MRQMSLFEENNTRAQRFHGFVPAIKAAMARAAKTSRFSREQILDQMNAIALESGERMTRGRAKTISLDTLDKWLAPDEREHVPGLKALHIFCIALDDPSPLQSWLAAFGCEAMTPEDRKLRDYGRACIENKARARAKRRLEEDLLEGLK